MSAPVTNRFDTDTAVWDGGGGISGLTDWTDQLVSPAGLSGITAFGEDGFGELYIVQFGSGTSTGEVLRIVEMTASGARQAPMRQ